MNRKQFSIMSEFEQEVDEIMNREVYGK